MLLRVVMQGRSEDIEDDVLAEVHQREGVIPGDALSRVVAFHPFLAQALPARL